MSLEEAIKENTAAVTRLIAVWEEITEQAARVDATKPMTAGGKPLADAKKSESTSTSAKPEIGAASDPKSVPAAEKLGSHTEQTAGAGTLTLDDVAARVKRLVGEKSRDDAVALLTEFAVKKASELKPEQYAAFIDRAEELLKGE